MNKLFGTEPTTQLPHNTFDLSHDNKLSCKMGKLVPVLNMDVVPGDKISIKPNIFTRFAPMLAPIMHKVNVYAHFYFVPNRILWDGWEDFITGGEDGQDNTVWPYIAINLEQEEVGGLVDYMGLPVKSDLGATGDKVVEVSALPFNAYQKIYDDYYRDQNLIPSTYEPLVDGPNTSGNLVQRTRAWQHDYFTSALPWTQRGPEALLPLTGNAPVRAFDSADLTPPYQQMKRADGTISNVGWNFFGGSSNSTAPNQEGITIGASGSFGTEDGYIDLNDTHFADLSQVTATSIIDVRRAFKLQEWLEKNARGGSRYTESIKVHFGVNSSDGRLQRPEYLGGMSAPVKISEVLQTNASNSDVQTFDTPQGTMAGHGISAGSGGFVSHRAEEHGYIIGILSVMPNSSYQQGIPKHYLKSDKFDYYWPEFAHVGEQAIEMQELLVGGSRLNTDTFGYTPRYAEYKFMNNSVHGDFKTTLDFWHMSRIFSDSPILNQDFIEMDNTETDRIFALYDPENPEIQEDNLWMHILFNIKAQRPMAIYGTPKF